MKNPPFKPGDWLRITVATDGNVNLLNEGEVGWAVAQDDAMKPQLLWVMPRKETLMRDCPYLTVDGDIWKIIDPEEVPDKVWAEYVKLQLTGEIL